MQSQQPPSPSPPSLRDDLRIMPFNDAEDEGYIIEDPLRNTFYKIGHREYQFLCYLDRGGRLEKLAVEYGDSDQISREEGETILKWLAGNQLLQKMGHEVLQVLEGHQKKTETRSWYNRLNLIIFKVPLFNPDPLLTRLMPWLGWLTGPLFFVIWAIMAVAALTTLAVNFAEFTSQGRIFFSAENLVIVGGIWLLLKFLHEAAHALTCRRYNGRVYEAGVLFILFFPLTYVNATSSWSFAHRWQRIHVTAAGILAELFIAWAALLFWYNHQGTVAGLIAHNTVIIAGLSSLLFNANPLMRFDGYYLLSDLVSRPNLYFLGVNSVKKAAKKWWLGIDEKNSGEESFWILIYGILVYLWRLLVLASLSILAALLFSGWGIIFVFISLIAWTYPPLKNIIKQLPQYRAENPGVLFHFLTRLALTGGVAVVCLFGIKWEKSLLAPAVVIYEEQHSIRAATAGFIDNILVQEGQRVVRGQHLFTLSNRDLLSRYRELEIKLKTFDLQERKAATNGNYGQLQILGQQKRVVEEQKDTLKGDLEALVIRASGDGVVIGEQLRTLKGIWASRGQELCQIINPEQTGLVASIDQDDINSYPATKGAQITVDMSEAGYGHFLATIDRVIPTASTELAHFSLAAPLGGPLDVQPVNSDKSNGYELLTPRISLYLDPPDTIRKELRDGLHGSVEVSGEKKSFGSLLFRVITEWISRKKEQTEIEPGR